MRIALATVITFSLIFSINPHSVVNAEGMTEASLSGDISENVTPRKENGFARALKAPFRALGKLFRRDRDDNKPRRMTEKDAQKFESDRGMSVKDANTPAYPTSTAARSDTPSASAQGMLSQGRAALDSGRLNEAIILLSGAVSGDSGSGDAYHSLGIAYARKGLWQLSKQSFERARRLLPTHPLLLNDYGYMLYSTGEYDDAVECLKRAAKFSPDNKRIWNNLALAQFRLGKQSDALKSFTKACGEFQALMNISNLLDRTGRDDQALKFYETARRLDPTSVELLQRLAEIYQRRGQFTEADAARRTLAAASATPLAARGN